jgi:hypothetical protein
MRVLLPLRKHANKQEDDDDDFLVLVDSDSEDGPQYIVHSLPEAAAALADPSYWTSQGVFQSQRKQAAFESSQEQLLVQFLLGGKERIGTENIEKEGQKQDTPTLDYLNGTSVEQLEFSHHHLQEHGHLQEDINPSLELDSTACKGKLYKTTGLEVGDSPIASLNSTSRKRKAHGSFNEGATSIVSTAPSLLQEAVSPLDQKPAASIVFKPSTLRPSDAKKMVSGRSSNHSSEQWRYYHHARDELLQESDDIRECPEGVEAEIENNPESARGDTPLGPAMSLTNIGKYAKLKSIARCSPEVTVTSPPMAADFVTERSPFGGPVSVTSLPSQDMRFHEALKQRGLEIREQDGDGNCLFRAISLQIYGDPSMHGDIRKQCMDFMVRIFFVNRLVV